MGRGPKDDGSTMTSLLIAGCLVVLFLVMAYCDRKEDSDAKREMDLHLKHLKDINPKERKTP